MKTISFIGSDKNAGKTTVLNFVVDKLLKKNCKKICLTSIGINGEIKDQYEQHCKPSIDAKEGIYFLTTPQHIKHLTGLYQILHTFGPPEYKKIFVLGKTLSPIPLVLEGPNEKKETIKIKQTLNDKFKFDLLIIDGSIDRQFIGHPQISDEFYFALLNSNRNEQRIKACDLLHPLSFPLCASNHVQFIKNNWNENTKSLLWNECDEIIHQSEQIPFLDQHLKIDIAKNQKEKIFLYLGGALSKTLYRYLAPFKNLELILDNFTLFLNISTEKVDSTFYPKITLLNPINVKTIFIKEESDGERLPIPHNVPIINIFREDFDALGI